VSAAGWTLVAFAVVFAINLVPYFMPPTWAVVSFFLIAYDLPFWPLCVGCALAATAGRCALALMSERWGRRLLTAQHRANVSALGQWLNERAGWREAVAVMVYSLGPIPSNQLFIAAGLSGARLRPIAAGFLVGRLVSYPALAFTARGVTGQLGSLFTQGWRDPKAIALELLSIVGVVVFARIDWPRLLHLSVPSVKGAAAPARSTGAEPAQSTSNGQNAR
jgi:membrane protein YqaA with SNARE-associated domain